MPKFNDLDIEKWKDSEIWTDSLWIIKERDKTGKHSGFYHGNFVPQIPRQLILRYTKKNDIVFDPFVGSGTTAYEAETLQRNFIGVDIRSDLIVEIQSKIDPNFLYCNLLAGDSTQPETFKRVKESIVKQGNPFVQLAILHPPYSDIIRFSDMKEDLSNAPTLEGFLESFSAVINNTIGILEKGRYLAIVIGDKYTAGKWVPLGFYCMQAAQNLGLTLKSIVVKNMEGNRAKQNKEAIWRYRALSSDYFIFKHEYILLFKN